jgi:hypothetical protein
MPRKPRTRAGDPLLLLLIAGTTRSALTPSSNSTATSNSDSLFDSCKKRFEEVIQGKRIINGYSSENISLLLYSGPIQGLDPSVNRTQFPTPTYSGEILLLAT